MTTTAKLTKTQAATLARFRYAVPVMRLNEVGEVSLGSAWLLDDRIEANGMLAGTLEALAKKGVITPRVISVTGRGWGHDVIELLADDAPRIAQVVVFPGSPACVTWRIDITSVDCPYIANLHGRERSRECNVPVPAEAVERVVAILTGLGWQVTVEHRAG